MNASNSRNLKKITLPKGHRFVREPLHFDGDLVIKGSAAECDITAVGHIVIHGDVRSSKICSQEGSVFLLHNVSDGANITAALNVYAYDVLKGIIRAAGDVIIESSSIASRVEAGNAILSESPDGLIMDSTLTAEKSVTLTTVGSRKPGSRVKIVVNSPEGFFSFGKLSPTVEISIGPITTEICEEETAGKAIVSGDRIVIEDSV